MTGWQAMVEQTGEPGEVSPLASPVTAMAVPAPAPVSGLPVGRMAFAAPTAGWVAVGSATDHQLLYTDDAGATWRSQLAWWGALYGDVLAFDERQALLVLGLWPQRPEVNGRPVALADHHAVFAGTVDAGASWMLGYPADRQGTMFDAVSPRRIWQQVTSSGQLVRTDDGGGSWRRLDGPEDTVPVRVAFESVREGLLVAAVRHRADELYATGDGGTSWSRVALPVPPGVPASAETWLTPVLRPAPGLLWLTAYPRREGTPPGWAGAYLYTRTGTDLRAWSGPYRLPRPAVEPWNGVVAPGADGRIWAGAGQQLWVADEPAGAWRPVPVPLPAGQSIAALSAVGDGVLWLRTAEHLSPGAVFSGRLYRGSGDGARWADVTPLRGSSPLSKNQTKP
jgi:hypothetical protein